MKTYLFLLTSVVLTAMAQITLKAGMSTGAVQRAVGEATTLDVIAAVGRSPAIGIGLILYVISVVFWLAVLSRIEVSRAYPFVGLAVVLTMVFGWLLFGEPLSAPKVVGTLLVAAGMVLVAHA